MIERLAIVCEIFSIVSVIVFILALIFLWYAERIAGPYQWKVRAFENRMGEIMVVAFVSAIFLGMAWWILQGGIK